MITLEFSLEVTGQGDASTVYFVTVVLFTDKMRFVASSFWNRNPSPALRSSVIEIVLEFPRFIVESIFNPFKKNLFPQSCITIDRYFYPNFSFNLRNE